MSISNLTSSPLPKFEVMDTPVKLKRRHETMEEQHQPDATSPENQRDSVTPAPPSGTIPTTPPSQSETEISSGQQVAKLQSSEDEQDASDEKVDPKVKIQDFEWHMLEEEYHDMIKSNGQEEKKLFDEFVNLNAFFKVWSETPHIYDSERSFKRLKTRITHVQHSENQLEKKRQHYIRVVQAFEGALQLLQQRPEA